MGERPASWEKIPEDSEKSTIFRDSPGKYWTPGRIESMMVSSGMGLDRKEQPMEPIWTESDGWEDGEKICGIWRTGENNYLACTYSASKVFKTLRAAMRWMISRGFEPRIEIVENN
jgi:hypothetical protein